MSFYEDLVSECLHILKNESIEVDSEKQLLMAETVQDLLFLSKQAHVWHLQTGSYAEHMALGDFYEKLEGCVDGLAEGYMGINGKFPVSAKSYSFVNYSKYDAIKILEEKQEELNKMFTLTADDSVLNGKFGALSELFASIFYKLKELK